MHIFSVRTLTQAVKDVLDGECMCLTYTHNCKGLSTWRHGN